MSSRNLKERLLEEAKRFLEEEGLKSLSMRNLGSSLGVSRTALYKHFKNKADLLSSIAEDGFNELNSLFIEIINRRKTAKERIKDLYREYFHYAVKNPACYRLMYGNVIMKHDRSPSLITSAERAFKTAMRIIIEGQRNREIKESEALKITNAAWLILHGYTIAYLDKQLLSPSEYPVLISKETTMEGYNDLSVLLESILYGIAT